MVEIKAFGRWSVEGINIEDKGLINYINLNPKIVPKTGARYAGNRFHKSKVFIVERLINKLMIPGHKSKKHFKSSGHSTGKANTSYLIVEKAFRIIEKKLNKLLIIFLEVPACFIISYILFSDKSNNLKSLILMYISF